MIDFDYEYDPEEHFDPADDKREDSIVYIRKEETEEDDNNGDKKPVPPISYRARIELATKRVKKDVDIRAAASDWWIENVCMQGLCDISCSPWIDQRGRFYCQALSDVITKVWLYWRDYRMPIAGVFIDDGKNPYASTRWEAKNPKEAMKVLLLTHIIKYQNGYREPGYYDRGFYFVEDYEKGISQAELAKIMDKNRKTLRKHLKEMEEMGFIVGTEDHKYLAGPDVLRCYYLTTDEQREEYKKAMAWLSGPRKTPEEIEAMLRPILARKAMVRAIRQVRAGMQRPGEFSRNNNMREEEVYEEGS
jgi:DNA-binding MarR family transcriptional regulator